MYEARTCHMKHWRSHCARCKHDHWDLWVRFMSGVLDMIRELDFFAPSRCSWNRLLFAKQQGSALYLDLSAGTTKTPAIHFEKLTHDFLLSFDTVQMPRSSLDATFSAPSMGRQVFAEAKSGGESCVSVQNRSWAERRMAVTLRGDAERDSRGYVD